MDTILLCGGHMDDAFVLGCIENIGPDCIIGIDRGLEFCYRNRIVPQYILGDFDSISPEVINWYRSRKEIPIREYKPEKDATDTRMGMELAMELGSDRIFLFGATGGRLDHYMGIGVSNELAEDTALVEFRQGFLLMVMSKDR